MEMKKIISETLKKTSDAMITASPASWCKSGLEEMPESMKKQR